MYKKKYMKYKDKYVALSRQSGGGKDEGGADGPSLVPHVHRNNPQDEGGADGPPLVHHVHRNNPKDKENFKRVLGKFPFQQPRATTKIAEMLFNPVERIPPVINPDIKRINIEAVGSGVLMCYIEINIREVREIIAKSDENDEEILKLLESYQKEIFSKLPKDSQYLTSRHIGLLYNDVKLTSGVMDVYKYREREDIMAITSDNVSGRSPISALEDAISEIEYKVWQVRDELLLLTENNNTDIIQVFNDNSAVLATEINLTFKIGGDEKTYNGPLYLVKYVFWEYLKKVHNISDIDKLQESYYIEDWVSDVSINSYGGEIDDDLEIEIYANFTKEGILYTDDSIDINFRLTITQDDWFHDTYSLYHYSFDIVYKNPLMDDIDLKDTLEQYFHN